MKAFRKGCLFAATLAALAVSVPTAFAQQKLRVADSFPVGHFIPEVATKVWMAEVTKATSGAVTFEYFPAEQLGKAKDLLSLTVSGVADVGYVAPSYISDKLPLSAVAELPGQFVSSCHGTEAFWKLAKPGGLLDKREFAPNGVRVLFAFVLPPYQFFIAKQKLETLKSLEGLKIRPTSGGLELVRRLKAVPVQLPAPEVYESLSRGTIDGVVFPVSSIFAYNLQGLVKYVTTDESLGSFVVTYAISERKWKTLPPNVQKAMTDAGEAAMRRACKYGDDNVAKDMEKMRQQGATMVKLPAADKKRLAELSTDAGQVWAEALDKRGKPGSEVFRAYRAALPPAK